MAVIEWKRGTVLQVLEEGEGIQWLAIRREGDTREERAVHYPPLFGRCRPGDSVWLNTTAVRLGLGTGGVHFVAGLIGRKPESVPVEGHLMKLRYTPWQVAVATGEEQGSVWHEQMQRARSLEGTPVLIGELHSMLPVAATVWHHLSQGDPVRAVYVMTDGGALPAPFSRHLRQLKALGWLKGTVTCGHAFGGDLEAVNLYSGLLLARYALKADLIFVSMGPGIAGTGTPYGFSGVEQGQAVNAVHSLNGVGVAIPRIQGKDPRQRHQGLSHHTITNLTSVALAPAVLPVPRSLPSPVYRQLVEVKENSRVNHSWIPVTVTVDEMTDWLEFYPETLRSMGKGIREDPLYYRTVAGSARVAFALWEGIRAGRTADETVARLTRTGV